MAEPNKPRCVACNSDHPDVCQVLGHRYPIKEIWAHWRCICGATGSVMVSTLADDAAIKSAFYWEHNRINPKCSAAYGTSFCKWEKGIGR